MTHDNVHWSYDSYHDMWECDCGEAYQFMNDGPQENRYQYCPGCGGRIFLTEEVRND